MKNLSARLLGSLFLSVALSGVAAATWSIVVVDRATGEVCVASATCIPNFPLEPLLPVVIVGKGGAAAQSVGDSSGANRLRIWNGLQADWPPERILELLAASDGAHQSRQYGIVSFDHTPVSFSGLNAGNAKEQVIGEVGDLLYAIQGNLLAGHAVVWKAEEALVVTPGDLSQRVMAAMEAARDWGGDGRCSCSSSQPDSCGSPPPSFTKSSHTSFLIVARLGDSDGTCTSSGCAKGDYWLNVENWGPVAAPDTITQLRVLYDAWRASKAGVPDHLRSEVLASTERLPADGLSQAEVVVRLFDLEGVAVGHGGQTIDVQYVSPGAPVASAGPVIDQGDGTHRFTLTATMQPGLGRWRLVVTQGTDVVQLHPELTLRVDPPPPLHVGFDLVSASVAPAVPFVLNLGASSAGGGYLLLGSAAGTRPGTPFGGIVLPLNRDRFFERTWSTPGPPLFPGSSGQLDAGGRATASLELGELFASFAGMRLDFCALLGSGPWRVAGPVGFEVVP